MALDLEGLTRLTTYDRRFEAHLAERPFLDWIEYLDVQMHDGYSSAYVGPVSRIYR